MALLNLLQLLAADDQQTIVDKINYDFDQILSMGGGPMGPVGFQGIQGVPGLQGVQGFQGIPGVNGSRWYVQPAADVPTSPTPAEGDLWLQTDTLAIYEFMGSPLTWTNLGYSIESTGVFTGTTGNNIVFTNPNPNRSLVLSPINYGGSDSQGTGNYKLKIVGESGSPLISLAITNDGINENSVTYQPTISIDEVYPASGYPSSTQYPLGINWILNVDNVNGDIFFNLNGNYLGIYTQLATVSRFDFGSQFRMQSGTADRLLSFAQAPGPTVEFFHIGRHDALTTSADRFFSIQADTGMIAIGDAFNNPSGAGAQNFHLDLYNPSLPTGSFFHPAGTISWLRTRGRINSGGTNFDSLNITHSRFLGIGSGPNNTMVKIQHNLSTSSSDMVNHYIGFGGGNTSIYRPQFFVGYNGLNYLTGDINGFIGIGSNAFLTNYNSPTNFFNAQLNIQGNNSTSITGGSSFSGIHLIPQDTVGGQVGVTAGGINAYENVTFAGLSFQDNSAVVDQGVDLHLGTSLYTDGGRKTRQTIWRYGDTYFWSKSNSTQYMYVEPGGKNINGTLYPNQLFHIGAYDSSSSWKDIVLNEGTDTTGFGSGFVGIGGATGFGEPISSGTLVGGQWYVSTAATSTIRVSHLFTHIDTIVNQGVPFLTISTFGYSTSVLSGTVALANPMTKFHVNDASTFGTRHPITSGSYTSQVGATSFTIGNNHTASSQRGIIIGGSGHTTTGTDGIIIGYNGTSGVNMTNSNQVLFATTTNVSMAAPVLPMTSLNVYTSGPASWSGHTTTTNIYNSTSLPIFNVSTSVTPAAVPGSMGDLARTMTLEGRSTSTNPPINIPVSMEFHVTNAAGSRYEIGMITGMLENAGTQVGRISFFVNDNGNLYESAYFNNGGLTFICPDGDIANYPLPTIQVEQNKDMGNPGTALTVSAGSSMLGSNDSGGNLILNPGTGHGTGSNGSILLNGNTTVNGNLTVDGLYLPPKDVYTTGIANYPITTGGSAEYTLPNNYTTPSDRPRTYFISIQGNLICYTGPSAGDGIDAGMRIYQGSVTNANKKAEGKWQELYLTGSVEGRENSVVAQCILTLPPSTTIYFTAYIAQSANQSYIDSGNISMFEIN
jgi:hypothetical protein